LIDLEVNLQNSVNLIWQEISNIDSQNVTALCGTSLNNFFGRNKTTGKITQYHPKGHRQHC
jgi:hypothetical protein